VPILRRLARDDRLHAERERQVAEAEQSGRRAEAPCRAGEREPDAGDRLRSRPGREQRHAAGCAREPSERDCKAQRQHREGGGHEPDRAGAMAQAE